MNDSEMNQVNRLVELIQEAADRFDVFQTRGPGKGNRVTNEAIAYLNKKAVETFGRNAVQRVLGKDAKQSVDFYLEAEGAIVEVEFSLSNPYPCLEKDAFKALLAREAGHEVRSLTIVGDPGSRKRMAAAAPQAIIQWLYQHHNLAVHVMELKRRGDPVTARPATARG